MRVPVVLSYRRWRVWTCVVVLCSFWTAVSAGQAEMLEAPTGVEVCQEGYGSPGTLRVSWANPEMYETAQLFVDGEPVALVDGADGGGVVQAPPGDHAFGVRGLVGASLSELSSVEFPVLEESPVPEPITNLDCEFIPTMGGLLRVTWSLGSDPWVRGRLGLGYLEFFPGYDRGGKKLEFFTC